MAADKVRETFLLNFKKRKPEQIQLISDWIGTQDNATGSIISLIQHAIDRFGVVDVLDHEVSKQLFAETLMMNSTSTQHIVSQDNIKSKNKNVLKQEDKQTEEEKSKIKSNDNVDKSEEKSPGIFTFGLDKNSF